MFTLAVMLYIAGRFLTKQIKIVYTIFINVKGQLWAVLIVINLVINTDYFFHYC